MYDPRTQNDFKPWSIETGEQLIWAMNKYEESIKSSRKSARFLFNCLFDYGIKKINNKINDQIIKLGARSVEAFNQEEIKNG